MSDRRVHEAFLGSLSKNDLYVESVQCSVDGLVIVLMISFLI